MNRSSSYIKNIEQFFLNLSRKGVMLSSRDYNLIQEWMDRGYELERVLAGIRKTFENKKNIRDLSDCIGYIESDTKKREYTRKENKSPGKNENDYLAGIISNLSNLRESEKDEKLINFYGKYIDDLKKFLNTRTKDIFSEINKLEEKFFSEFQENLEEKKAYEHQLKLNEFINSGNDYINEKAKNKALNNHSKNLIIDNYLKFNPFEL